MSKILAEKLKKEMVVCIDNQQEKLFALADFIFQHPEIGFKEKQASEHLIRFLSEGGFSIEKNYTGLSTAFRAVYEQGKGGPRIGLLCEYDALKNIGHACGHHLQGPAIIGAAMAAKKVLDDAEMPYVLEVIGTPGEECSNGGKNIMMEQGAFKELDVALMMHASDSTTTDIHSMARSEFSVAFHGKSAHSAIAPERGRSALEAAILAFNGIGFLRGHVKDDTRIHGIVAEGGKLTNVIPDETVIRIEVRSYDSVYLKSVENWVKKILEGASLMTGTTYSVEKIGGSLSKIPVRSLNKVLMDNAVAIKAPAIAPPREKTGSTDFASVMFHIPGSCIRVGFIEKGTAAHSKEWLEKGLSDDAHQALIVGAKTLALTVFDLVTDTRLLQKIKKEFKEEKMRAIRES